MGCLVRLIMGIFLIALLINMGPALLQGLISGVAEGGKEAAGQIGDAAKDWAKQKAEDALPDWVKETKSDAGKVLEVAKKIEKANAKNLAYYQHCVGNHAWRESGGRIDTSICLNATDRNERTACFESGAKEALVQRYGRAQADDVMQVVVTDCAQYIGMSGGIVKAGGGLFGAATEWIRCYVPEWCSNPELENQTNYKCLQDAVVTRRVDARNCGAYVNSGTDWRMCVEIALDQQVVGDMGRRDVQACRDAL